MPVQDIEREAMDSSGIKLSHKGFHKPMCGRNCSRRNLPHPRLGPIKAIPSGWDVKSEQVKPEESNAK